MILTGLLACDDIPRDNPLDPKNPDSFRNRIIAVEAFVNQSSDFSVYALQALNEIRAKYQQEITVIQYHRNQPDGLIDPDALTESEFIYSNYIDYYDNAVKGVPDIFINGVEHRIQGASSKTNCLNRLESKLQPVLSAESYFTIETDIEKNQNDVTVHVTIARLGSETVENILVRTVLLERENYDVLQQVARGIKKSTVIPSLDAGEQKEIEIGTFDLSPFNGNLSLVIQILNKDEFYIYQSLEVSQFE